MKGNAIINMAYDRMGRRVTKNNQRFVYDGYLQIAEFTTAIPNSSFLLRNSYAWDPTEPVATRPLAWTTPTTNHESPITNFYTHDGNKNVSEVIASDNDVAAHYEYAPFGALTVSSGVFAAVNPWRFSSEYAEDDTATVYYNYRHYEPVTGRWMGRDPSSDALMQSDYLYVDNNPAFAFDSLGLLGVYTVDQAGSDCQGVIDSKRGRAGWTKHSGEGEVRDGYGQCYRKIREAFLAEPLSSLAGQFGGECPLPPIKCGCCEWSSKLSGGRLQRLYTLGSFTADKYDNKKGRVKICWNNLVQFESGDDSALNRLLTHELTHALQSCKGRPGGCEGSLKKEIEARVCAKECKGFDQCFKKAIKSSCGYHCKTAQEITPELVDELRRWYIRKISKGNGKGGFCSFYP